MAGGQLMSAFRGTPAKEGIAGRVYQHVKQAIFEFELLPGDRFSESDIANRVGVSRTPVRQALYALEQEGYLDVQPRSGWQVKPVDFDALEAFYDLRVVLETEAVRRLCQRPDAGVPASLQALVAFWIDSPPLPEGSDVAQRDEAFHMTLVSAAGNPEMARVHRDVTEKIRIVRRLDFTQAPRVAATYAEHSAILLAIIHRDVKEASDRLNAHIAQSQKEVRNITLHMLQQARQAKCP